MKPISLALAVALVFVAAKAGDTVLRDGDYLSELYLTVLEKTKSHHKAYQAWRGSAPQAIRVSRDGRGLVLFLGYNWHEGDQAVFNAQNPSIQVDVAEFHKKTLIPRDTVRFRFKDGDGPVLDYLYIGNEQTFLMEKLLVGTYADSRGQTYAFDRDGKARFPDRTFHYEIYTDMVFEDGDEFVDRDASKPDAWKIYGFARRADQLFLYNAVCDDTRAGCTTDRKHPIAVLRKLKPAR
jgi:hypothetical protein